MLEDFLNQNRELFVIAPSKLLKLLNEGFNVSNKEVACIFYREDENEYDIVVGNKQIIIDESTKDDDYKGREYTTITIKDKESEKILTLLTMGLDFKDIIYMQYIKGKEDTFKWNKYET